MPAPESIHALIDHFRAKREEYKSDRYNETQARVELINPFFEALGWDINNAQHKPPSMRDVVHEDELRTPDHRKFPDYAFRIGGVRKFCVEAKKPARSLIDYREAAYQLRSYGWSAGLPLSILTDFAEFAVYDCRIKPDRNDEAKTARLYYFTFEQYDEHWETIASLFGYEAVLNGALDRFAESDPPRGAQTVDAAFLKDLNLWRRLLAKRLWPLNRDRRALSEADINYAVQKILDRIIFLRICEDRGAERYGTLLAHTNGSRIYARLNELFKAARDRYNSGLFYFPPPERDHAEQPDSLTPDLIVDDETLTEILKGLYHPYSPYVFSEIPIEILGQAYERFLGDVIRIETKANQTIIEIEPKPEVRKAGGVYYTPTYIVDYIVAQTLTPLLEGKTPAQAARLRILDPACGSGSFLIGAYQFLLDWYLRAYSADSPEKHERKGILRRVTTKNGFEWRLSIQARKDILTNNLYGVDIDSRAVETTKLSLLLRALEGETDETINQQLQLWRTRALPDLGRNIQCGNALIGPDFEHFAAQRGLQLSAADYARINHFDWHGAFPKVFAEGGFDAVIGNPPYSAELADYERDYLKKRYPIGSTNTAALMMVQAHRLLKDKGVIGMIVPKSFTYASTWQKTRSFFEPELAHLVDVGRAWREVNLEQSIFVALKGAPSEVYLSSVRQGKAITGSERIDKADCRKFGFFLNGISSAELRIAKKVASVGAMLGDFVTNTRGGMLQSKVGKTPSQFEVIGGTNIARWRFDGRKGYLQLPDEEIERLPHHAFVQSGSLLVQNIVTHVRTPVGGIRIVGTLPDADHIQHIVILDTVNQLANRSPMASEYLLALLHAKLINWYVYRFIFAKASITMHLDGVVTNRIPVKALDLSKPKERAMHDQIVAAVQTLLDLHKQLATAASPATQQPLQRRIAALERKIDEWVYQLYGLSAEEIALIEGEAAR
jgi:hypothetical protein